jgi:hypothetical protein
MANINHIISLGIGSPAAIQEFLTFGLQQGTGGAVFPDPSEVASGVTYGPTGADYTGTKAGGGGYMRRR